MVWRTLALENIYLSTNSEGSLENTFSRLMLIVSTSEQKDKLTPNTIKGKLPALQH